MQSACQVHRYLRPVHHRLRGCHRRSHYRQRRLEHPPKRRVVAAGKPENVTARNRLAFAQSLYYPDVARRMHLGNKVARGWLRLDEILISQHTQHLRQFLGECHSLGAQGMVGGKTVFLYTRTGDVYKSAHHRKPAFFVLPVIFGEQSGIPLNIHVELRFPTLRRLLQT